MDDELWYRETRPAELQGQDKGKVPAQLPTTTYGVPRIQSVVEALRQLSESLGVPPGVFRGEVVNGRGDE